MMRKKIFVPVAVLVFLVVAYIVYAIFFDRRFKFDLTENESKVLIDSVKINGSMNLYWFKYESYIGNTTVSFMSIGTGVCDCNMENAFVKGEFIQGIKAIEGDSIYILSRYGFDIIKPTSSYHFVDIRTDRNADSLKHIEKYSYFRDLCK